MAETKKTSGPQWVQVVENLLPDKTGQAHQAGQIVAAAQFNNVADLLAAGKLAPVDADQVVAHDAKPEPGLLRTLQVRARTEAEQRRAAQVTATERVRGERAASRKASPRPAAPAPAAGTSESP
jgi:hypothetical protein